MLFHKNHHIKAKKTHIRKRSVKQSEGKQVLAICCNNGNSNSGGTSHGGY